MSSLWYEGLPLRILSKLRAAAPTVSLLNETQYFKSVEALDLSETGMLVIPDWLIRMTNLKYLDLSHNHIETLYGKDLPSSLLTLNILDNDLEVVNFDGSYLPNLYALNLSHNLLVNVPWGLETLSKLREVHLSRNEIRSIEGVNFPSSLSQLHLSRNNLEKLPDTKPFGLDKLVVFGLNLNNLRTIPTWVVELSHLRQLYIAGNELEDWEFDVVKPATLQLDL